MKEEMLLKPETFKVINADVPISIWTYIFTGVIAFTVIMFILIMIRRPTPANNDNEKLYDTLRVSAWFSLFAIGGLLGSVFWEGNPYNTGHYRYIVAEVDTNSHCYTRYFNDPHSPIFIQNQKRLPRMSDKFVEEDNKLYFYEIVSKDYLSLFNPCKEEDQSKIKYSANESAISYLRTLYDKSGQDSSRLIFDK